MHKTNWKLYTSNEETLEAMIVACNTATESIDLEQFIFIPDEFSNRLIDICIKKALEGIKIRFIWDAAGSFSFFGSRIIDEFKSKGIELIYFKTLLPKLIEVTNYRSWYFRNHRRTLIIDGEIAFTGSICMFERSRDWRDTNIMIDGPIVQDIQKTFNRIWNRAKNNRILGIKNEIKSENEFKYISNSPLPGHRKLYAEIIDSIKKAKEDIYITTPYFIPTHRFLKAIKIAIRNNVKIHIMIPEKSDHKLADLCARTYFHNLLKNGIRIFIYKDIMLHSKTIVIDDNWSSIGTLNIDHVSLLYNFEANIISNNTEFNNELKNHFFTDLNNCYEMKYEEWNNRSLYKKIISFFIKFIRIFF